MTNLKTSEESSFNFTINISINKDCSKEEIGKLSSTIIENIQSIPFTWSR